MNQKILTRKLLPKFKLIPILRLQVKGALDKYNIIPQHFYKNNWDFYTIRRVGMGNDCMLSFTFEIDLLLRKYEYF